MTVTTDKTLSLEGRDPDLCQEVVWCDRKPHPFGDHVREIESLVVRGPEGQVPIAVRQTGPGGRAIDLRTVQLQVDGVIVPLSREDVATLQRALRVAVGDGRKPNHP